ncbi:MAG: MFS transporter, partial [Halobacteria archaeon]|nr:MFS transporter [Halobacteria archaeon]
MYIVLFPPILLILSEDFGVTLTALGIAMGVQGLVNTSLQLPFGYLSDNYSRTWTLAASLTFGSLGVLTVALAESYAWLLVGQAILGIGISAHHPAHYPLLADSTPENLRGRVYSVHGFAGSLGFATPPVLITAIISFEGLTWRHAVGFIGLIGAMYAVIAIIVLYRYVGDNITLPSISEETQRRLSVRERIRQELRSVVSSPPILALGLITFLTSTASWGITSYLVVLLNRGYGVPQDIANLTLTGMFVASAIMILVGGELTDRISAGPVMITSYSLVAVMVMVFGSLSVPAMV